MKIRWWQRIAQRLIVWYLREHAGGEFHYGRYGSGGYVGLRREDEMR